MITRVRKRRGWRKKGEKREKERKRERKKKVKAVCEREGGRKGWRYWLAPAGDVSEDFLFRPVPFSPGGHHYCFRLD